VSWRAHSSPGSSLAGALGFLLAVPAIAGADARVTLEPATAVARAPVSLRGEGFPARARVVVTIGRAVAVRLRANARGRLATSLAAPVGRWSKVHVITRGGGREVVSVLVRAPAAAPPSGEVASSTGARLRWTPTSGRPGQELALHGAGLGARRRVRVQLAGATWTRRTSTTGRFRHTAAIPTIAPGVHRGVARAGGLVLPFTVLIEPPPFALPPPGSTPLVGGPPAGGGTPSPSTPPLPIDTTPPASPRITGPAEGSAVKVVRFEGEAEPGEEIELLEGAVVVGGATTAADGRWTITPVTPGDGEHTYTAVAIDAAGNRSGPTGERRVIVDTIAPASPRITGPAEGSAVKVVRFEGEAEPGEEIELLEGAVVVGGATTAADGRWTITPVTPGDGEHTYTAVAIDAAGNRSGPTGERRVIVDTIAPAPPMIISPREGEAVSAVRFVGEAEPGAEVEVREGAVVVGTATTAGDGTWTMTAATPDDGEYTYAAVATDAADNRSQRSAPVRVTVDTTPPAPPSITTPGDYGLSSSTRPTLIGNAEPGSTVEAFEGALSLGTTTAAETDPDGDGNFRWSLRLDAVTEGRHVYTVTATDAARNRSLRSAERHVTVEWTQIEAGPSATSRRTSASFAFSGASTATFECSLDGEEFEPCSSPHSYGLGPNPPLADGRHRFEVRAVSSGGTADPTPAALEWTVDTGALAQPDVVVAAAGDIACGLPSCRQDATAKVIDEAIRPDAVLGLGDYQYDQGTLDLFERWYDPYWGRFKAKTYAINGGSHDFWGTWDYLTYFTGAAAQLQPEGSFSFDLGHWHLIALNSYCFERSSCDDAAVTNWLVEDLKANEATCTLAYLHQPYWTSDTPVHERSSNLRPWIEALHAAGAELLLQAHNHHYERFDRQAPDDSLDEVRGLEAFVVGTGGRGFYSLAGAMAPNSRVHNSNTFGVLKLTLHETSYDFEFVPVAGGTFTDSGSTACH
jgi:hypothetical protein